MTLDERVEFLVRSTESLHQTVGEMMGPLQEHTLQLREQTAQLKEQTRHLQEHTKHLQIDAENIRRLANVAQSHETRLSDLEGDSGKA